MEATFFERLGGEEEVRRLVDRFYDLMDTLPEAKELRDIHPPDLGGSRDKLFWFMCGWLGGPSHYVERFGHPRLRARHLPFAIGTRERDQWMMCMERAMRELIADQQLIKDMHAPIARLADHMRNQSEQQRNPVE